MKDFGRTVLIGIIVLIVIGGLWYFFFQPERIPIIQEKEAELTKEELVKMAQDLYKQKKQKGLDMSDGPCLTNELAPGWVVDVAHDPRQSIDNQPENQCSAYRQGKAKHFIELDTEGNLIRME